MLVKVILVDVNPKMVDAWKYTFEENPRSRHRPRLHAHAERHGLGLSPTNARGSMDGGLDMIIKNFLGVKIEKTLQQEIARLYNGLLPVGHATCIPTATDWPRYLISTPTMVASSEDISDSLNVALACAAAFQAVHMQNAREPGSVRSIVLPGLGANTGKVPVEICADLMWSGYDLFRRREFSDFAAMRRRAAREARRSWSDDGQRRRRETEDASSKQTGHEHAGAIAEGSGYRFRRFGRIMNLQALRLYSPKGPDRLAVLSVQPSSAQAGSFLIQLPRGTGPGPLTKGTVYGPFAEADLDARFAEVVAALKTEGFVATGLHELLGRMDHPSAATRARAALGLGWRRAGEGVDLILSRLPKAVDEVCSYIDALGALGDARAAPILREHAGRKLLSRRRSAVEALRNLGDAVGVALASQQALERLPEAVRILVQNPHAEREEYINALLALKIEQRGLALDTLYELATPLTIDVTRAALLLVPFDQAHIWALRQKHLQTRDVAARLRYVGAAQPCRRNART